jgi:hypothetical protein
MSPWTNPPGTRRHTCNSGRGPPVLNAHWCVRHFLLDGHHKIQAAASSRCPPWLLSTGHRDQPGLRQMSRQNPQPFSQQAAGRA